MERIPSESKEGVYDVYVTAEGKKLYVLEGLSVQDQIDSPPLQQFIHAHYMPIATLYWIIFATTIIYLVGIYIFIPLLRRYELY